MSLRAWNRLAQNKAQRLTRAELAIRGASAEYQLVTLSRHALLSPSPTRP